MRKEFIAALKNNQSAFGVDLGDATMERLADYYDLILEHNPILHLVAPCPPEEFATRHILESLALLEYLPANARFADIGSGGGLPAIPCLIARSDLSAVLIESKEKKIGFLSKVSSRCGLAGCTELVARQFSEIRRPDVSRITCRALDRFTENLRRLISWSSGCPMLLFGGPNLSEALSSAKVNFERRLLPLSEKRYLFIESGKNRASGKIR